MLWILPGRTPPRLVRCKAPVKVAFLHALFVKPAKAYIKKLMLSRKIFNVFLADFGWFLGRWEVGLPSPPPRFFEMSGWVGSVLGKSAPQGH